MLCHRSGHTRSPRRLPYVCLLLGSLLLLPSTASAYEKQIQEVAQTIVERLEPAPTRTIAVSDFTDLQGNVTELGRFLAEELSVALTGVARVEVVDRVHLRVLLAEHELSTSGLIDPATAKELGKIAGVDALITGTVTPFGDSVRLAVKVLNTATARMIGASTSSVPRTSAIEELLSRGIGTAALPSMPPSGGLRGGGPPTVLGAPFETGRLKVEAMSLGVSQKTGVATLAVQLTNLTDRDLLIGLERGNNLACRLIDDQGNSFVPVTAQGISSMLDYRAVDPYKHTRLDPGAAITIVFVFQGPEKTTFGNRFSFGASLLEYRGTEEEGPVYNRISLGLNNLAANVTEG